MKKRLQFAQGFERFKNRRKNKTREKRLCLERNIPESEGGNLVVKGISKRVIVVKSPDPKIFEQAIFIIREDFAGQSGVSDKDVLREAKIAANRYMGNRHCGRPRGTLAGLRAPLYAAAGAAATGLAWIAVQVSHF